MRKKIIIIITIIIAMAAAAGGYWYFQKNRHNSKAPGAKSLADIQRNLTVEQEKAVNGRIQKAEDYLKTLKPEQKNYNYEQANTYEYLGQQYYALGQMQKSKDMYEKALALEPDDESMQVGLATTLTEAGDKAGARQFLEKALQSNPKDSDLWLRYIDLRQTMGATAQDLGDLYSQALEKTNNYIDVLTKDAAFQEQQGNTAAAISLWQQASKQQPDNQAYKEEIGRLQKLQ
ncbi:MAG: tetratricopeptide repeat protein [Patescibacteria group bacterium]|nr:tetratricopeptide repeat protein [Patescibacteria group bacterium]